MEDLGQEPQTNMRLTAYSGEVKMVSPPRIMDVKVASAVALLVLQAEAIMEHEYGEQWIIAGSPNSPSSPVSVS